MLHHSWRLHAFFHHGIEFLHDHLWRSQRRNQAPPTGVVKSRHGLGDGRHIRRAFYTAREAHAQHFEAARGHMRQYRRQRSKAHMHLARDQIGKHGAAAFVRHMQHINAGHFHQQHAAHVVGCAGARRAKIQFARLRFGVCNEFAHVVWRQAAERHQRIRHVRRQTNRRKVGQGIVGCFQTQRGAGDHATRGGEQQRIAIGRRFGNEAVAQCCARAGTAVDHYLLTQRFGNAFAQCARGKVGTRTRRIRHNKANGFGGVLRMRRNREQAYCRDTAGQFVAH